MYIFIYDRDQMSGDENQMYVECHYMVSGREIASGV
jgi:hypothetical protein